MGVLFRRKTGDMGRGLPSIMADATVAVSGQPEVTATVGADVAPLAGGTPPVVPPPVAPTRVLKKDCFFGLDAAWLNEGRCPGGRPSVS